MNIKPVVILTVCAFFTGGCNKSPTSTTANNSGSQPPPPIQAEPFHGQVYKSANGRNVLTLTTKDECELMQDGTTLLCKYTKQTDALRVIATVMGTPQVIYYRFTDQGLQDNNGNVLLSPEKYAAAIEQIQRQQQEVEKARLEKQSAADVIAKSQIETQTISTFSLYYLVPDPRGQYIKDGSLTLTDVSLKLHVIEHYVHYNNEYDGTILFVKIRKIGDIGEGTSSDAFIVDVPDLANVESAFFTARDAVLHFKSETEARTVRDAVLNAYNAWKAKFPEAVLK
jgi:hypothetical protein